MKPLSDLMETPTSVNKLLPTQSTSNSNSMLVMNTTRNFYKIKMCPYFLHGKCTKGSSCTFAHSKDELREQPNLHKTKLCRAFSNGSCRKAYCPFAHGTSELKATSDIYKTSLCTHYQEGINISKANANWGRIVDLLMAH